MTRVWLLAGLVMVGGLSIGAAAVTQPQAPRPAVRDIQKVRDNLSFISGGDTDHRPTWTGGNVSVLVADAGVVLVTRWSPTTAAASSSASARSPTSR